MSASTTMGLHPDSTVIANEIYQHQELNHVTDQTSLICFYHAPCNDGAAAAAALEYRIRKAHENTEIDVRFCPLAYNSEWDDPFQEAFLQSELQPRWEVHDIFFVDVSISETKFNQVYEFLRAENRIKAGAIRVVCIDHHQTALDRLDELSAFCTETDIRIGPGLSGATLVWEFFNREFGESLPMPELLRYIADQDIWEWKLEHSVEVNAALNVLNGTVDDLRVELETSMRDPETWFRNKLVEGRAIARMVEAQVWRTARNVRDHECNGSVLRIVNSTAFNSEAGNHLCNNHKLAPNAVALLYTVQDDFSVRCSFRSIAGGAVSARMLAERFGGGGHEHAAGCRFDSFSALIAAVDRICRILATRGAE